MYRSRLASPHGRSGKEVAVKTLKGKLECLFHYRGCVGSVICKVIMVSIAVTVIYVARIRVYNMLQLKDFVFVFCVYR